MVRLLYPFLRIYQEAISLRATRLVLGGKKGGQLLSVGDSLGQVAGMLPEGQEHFRAEVTAFLAELIVHPEALPANVNPTAPFQVGQVAGHG